MLRKFTFPLLFFLIFLSIINIKHIYSANSIRLQQLLFQNSSLLEFKNSDDFFLYLNISSMQYEEQGIITFYFPKEIINQNFLLPIFATVKRTKENIINSFPLTKSDSIFPTEVSMERFINPAFESVLHLYFNKTINETSNTYLLIELQFKPEMTQYWQASFAISKVSLIEDITFKSYYGKIDFYKPITRFIPIFVSFDLKDKAEGENVFFYCKENIMTVYYGHVIKDNKINKQTKFTNLASSDQYYLSVEEIIKHKKLILKFMTDIDMLSIGFSIGYMQSPLILWKSVITSQGFPIEITRQNQNVFMVGLKNQRLYGLDNYYLHVEHVYGKHTVYHSPIFLPYYLMSTSTYLLRSQQSFKQMTDVKKIDTEVNFIQVSCSSPCRLNIILFLEHKMNMIYTSGVFYYAFSAEGSRDILIKGSDEFYMEIEALNQQSRVEIYHNNQHIKYDSRNWKMRELCKPSSDKSYSVSLKAQEGTIMKLFLHKDYQFTVVPLGKSKYYLESLEFKLERNMDIDRYVIEIELMDSNTLNYFYEYYGIGDNTQTPFPFFRTFTIKEKRVISLSNPYDKTNPRIVPSENQFYYYAFRAFDDNISPFTVNFYQIRKELNPQLIQNKPILMEINSNRPSNYTLLQSLSSDSQLILQFFKCSSSPLEYNLSYNGMLIKQSELKLNRLTNTLYNYYVNYSISFFGPKKASLIFSYSYCELEMLEDLLEVRNRTIRYRQEGPSTIRLEWNTYLNNTKEQEYSIYIKEYHSDESNCSFILEKPYDVVYHPKVIKEAVLNYTVRDLKKGVYRVNIVAQENKLFHFSQIYDEVIISIENPNHHLVSDLLRIIAVLLFFATIFLYWLAKAKKR